MALSDTAERESSMRAAMFYEHGGRDKLVVEDVARPTAGRDEIVVEVQACALNHLDIFVRRGMPGVQIDLPRITGGDIAGVVADVGEGVTQPKRGDRVLLDPMVTLPDGTIGALGEHTTGGLAEYVVAPAQNSIALPESVSFVEAAALPIAYGTAWKMLMTRGEIRAGEHVVILGASGGVGTACVQIAKQKGCVVYACASSDEKLARLKELGADVLLNYADQPEFHRFLRRLTDGGGVDAVVDYTGAATWNRSLKSLRHGGRLLTCGATSGFDANTDIRYIWTRELNILGSDGWTRDGLISLLAAVRDGRITPVIDRVLPLEEIREAHRLLEDREVFGKVVITPGVSGG